MVSIHYYLLIAAFMMFAGIYGFFTRRSLLVVLISVELIINAVDINFAVFNRFLYPDQLEGMFFSIFSIGLSAVESAVAIAIIILGYRNLNNIHIDHLNKLKD